MRHRRTNCLACGPSPHRAVGIDINAFEIDLASRLCTKLHPEQSASVEYLVSKEDKLLDLGEFDYVLLVDSMEHVVSPPSILRLAYHYPLKSGWFVLISVRSAGIIMQHPILGLCPSQPCSFRMRQS